MALAGAFLTTSGGFGILFFHNLPPLQQFGVMIALSIAYSFFASVYVLPTFLVLWAKWRRNYRNKRGLEDEGPEAEDESEELPEDDEIQKQEPDMDPPEEEESKVAELNKEDP
jgi:predicted RND superfamily exporter protein